MIIKENLKFDAKHIYLLPSILSNPPFKCSLLNRYIKIKSDVNIFQLAGNPVTCCKNLLQNCSKIRWNLLFLANQPHSNVTD